MNPSERIQRYLTGVATGIEIEELDHMLARDPALRRKLIAEAGTDAGLRAIALERASQPMLTKRRRSGWLSWRPLAAAAAGLVIGAFSASVVYGFVVQRQTKVESVLMEGFEDKNMRPDPRVPNRVGVWGGDLLSPQVAEAGVKPAEGRCMVKLPWVDGRKMTYAFRFLDMAKLSLLGAAETRQIEVTARFQGASPIKKDRFQIRLAAFAEEVGAAREIWVNDFVDEMALMHVAKTVKTEADASGWTTVRSVIDVPASAQVVLISLAAGIPDTEIPKAGYYLDDMQVRLFTHETPLP